MSLCTLVGGASGVLGVGWKLACTELFVFARGGPTAPTGVERHSCGSSAQGIGKVVEVGLGQVLGLTRGPVAGFLTAISKMEVVSNEQKSKYHSNT